MIKLKKKQKKCASNYRKYKIEFTIAIEIILAKQKLQKHLNLYDHQSAQVDANSMSRIFHLISYQDETLKENLS